MMSVPFSKEDVHKHLLDLGYSNITNEQLREFMTDLKRLMRYEEKQRRIEAHLEYTAKSSKDQNEKTEKEKSKHFSKVRQRHISADSSYSTASSIGYESDEAPKKAKISTRNRPKTGDHLTRPINEKVKNDRNIWIEQEHASHKNDNFPQIKVTRNTLRPKEPPNYDNSSHISSTGLLHGALQESTQEECQIQINIPKSLASKTLVNSSKENVNPSASKKFANVRKEACPDFDGGCWEMLNQDAIQILPPRPKIPTKPTTSCIKPTFKETEKKDLRRDPVQLHDYYKKHWSKLKLPGDDSQSTKQVRWAVREWMMAKRPPE